MSLGLESTGPLRRKMSQGAVLYPGAAGLRIRAEKKRIIA
jgi:hypothetical protein